jgi:GxxExxY protein
MAGKRIETPYDALTYQIIGCAMATHRRLGPGLREDTYQRDLEVQFTGSALSYQPQKLIEVHDTAQRNALIGYYIPDFVVAEQVIVEIEALPGLDNSHVAQVIGSLAVTGCPVGLLINFGARSLQFRRILPPTKIPEHAINRQWLWVPDSWKEE